MDRQITICATSSLLPRLRMFALHLPWNLHDASHYTYTYDMHIHRMHNRNAYYLHSYTINIINWQAPMFKMDLMMPCYVQTSISQPKTSETRGLSGSPGYARRHQKATLDEVRPGPSADPGWVWESLWWCITIHHPGSSIPRSIKQDDFILFDEIPRWKQHCNNTWFSQCHPVSPAKS